MGYLFPYPWQKNDSKQAEHVAGIMETASGVKTVTYATLPGTVLKANHAETSMAVSWNFMRSGQHPWPFPLIPSPNGSRT